MEITYLGHAGFLLETGRAIFVTDPWMSPEGAFDSAWFQFPCNHHLGPVLREKLEQSAKPVFVYISHEHRDHYDPAYLRTLPAHKITFLVPEFHRPLLLDELAKLQPAGLISGAHGKEIPVPGGTAKLYIDDSGLNRDSAILIKADGATYLNLNDCKLYDEAPCIRAQEGPISILTCQFSGATWHPTCYDYDRCEYERISRQKLQGKFEMVARAIEAVQPEVYVPSAGPVCFLDPALLHLNFETVNIFPRAPQFLDFLRLRLRSHSLKLVDMMPGDVLRGREWELEAENQERVLDESFADYVHSYAGRYSHLFPDRQLRSGGEDVRLVFEKLKTVLQEKLDAFTLHDRIKVPLYFGFTDHSAEWLRIDFPLRKIERTGEIRERDFYSLHAPSWQVERILQGAITWEEFALTFRMRLNRRPDVYQTLIQGFLLKEPEDMNWFCSRLVEIEQRRNRLIIEAGGTRYSIDRYCPHQGADLSQGWLADGRLWTCPRHRWQFALDKEGQCLTSNASINAVCLEGE